MWGIRLGGPKDLGISRNPEILDFWICEPGSIIQKFWMPGLDPQQMTQTGLESRRKGHYGGILGRLARKLKKATNTCS